MLFPDQSLLPAGTGISIVTQLSVAGAFAPLTSVSQYNEDFPFFTTEPYIPSTYFKVGGTPQADFDREADGGAAVPSHHSPLFKIESKVAVTLGVEASVRALQELLQNE